MVVIRLVGNCDSANGPNAMTLKIVSKGTFARTIAQGKERKECEQCHQSHNWQGRIRGTSGLWSPDSAERAKGVGHWHPMNIMLRIERRRWRPAPVRCRDGGTRGGLAQSFAQCLGWIVDTDKVGRRASFEPLPERRPGWLVFSALLLLALAWFIADIVGLATLNVILIAISTPLVVLFAWGSLLLRPAQLRHGGSSTT